MNEAANLPALPHALRRRSRGRDPGARAGVLVARACSPCTRSTAIRSPTSWRPASIRVSRTGSRSSTSRCTWRQLFEFGALHTDPHPGNYMVTHHPASLHAGPRERAHLRRSRSGAAYLDLADEPARRRRRAGMSECFLRLGFLDPGDDPAPMIRIMRLVFEPALVDGDYDPQAVSVGRARHGDRRRSRSSTACSNPRATGCSSAARSSVSSRTCSSSAPSTNWRRVFREGVDARARGAPAPRQALTRRRCSRPGRRVAALADGWNPLGQCHCSQHENGRFSLHAAYLCHPLASPWSRSRSPDP